MTSCCPTHRNQRAQEINTHRPIPPMDIRTIATTNHGSDIVQPCQHYNRGERQELERETHKQHTMSVPLPINGRKGWWINTKSAHRSNCTSSSIYTGAPKGPNRHIKGVWCDIWDAMSNIQQNLHWRDRKNTWHTQERTPECKECKKETSKAHILTTKQKAEQMKLKSPILDHCERGNHIDGSRRRCRSRNVPRGQ